MLERFTKITALFFSLLWAMVIFVEYYHNNPYYANAFQYFQYADLLIVFLLIGATLSWGLKKAKKRKLRLRFINGLSIFGGLLVLDSLTLATFYSKVPGISLTLKGLFLHLGYFVGVAFCVYLVGLICRKVGNTLTFLFPPKIAEQDLPIIEVAIGIVFTTFLLFFLGMFSLLNAFVIAPIFAFILLFDWRKTRQIIYQTLFRPIPISNRFNALGVFSFLFLALFLVFDFAQILRPFPLGVDSINLYVNLPSLIAQYGGLVDGNQPYNWSLFMSLGLVLFGRVDVVLALSFLGSFLSLVTLYRLSRRWLDVNHAALCLLLYFSVPMVNFLSQMDMKIDMGLLYITLCILILLVNWLWNNDKSISTSMAKKVASNPQQIATPIYLIKVKKFISKHLPPILIEHRLVVWMGIFVGFAFGIKLTALFVFFALMTVIWYAKGGLGAFLTSIFLTIGATFLLQLDGQAQLREFHQSVALLQWTFLLLGLGLIAYMALKQKRRLTKLVHLSLILSIFFVLPVLPWLGKNWSETKSFSTEALLNGKNNAPSINLKVMEKNWEKIYK